MSQSILISIVLAVVIIIAIFLVDYFKNIKQGIYMFGKKEDLTPIGRGLYTLYTIPMLFSFYGWIVFANFQIATNSYADQNALQTITYVWAFMFFFLGYWLTKRRLIDTNLNYKWRFVFWAGGFNFFLMFFLFFKKSKDISKQMEEIKSKDKSLSNNKNNFDNEESKFVSKQLKKLNKKDQINETDHSSYMPKIKDIKQDENTKEKNKKTYIWNTFTESKEEVNFVDLDKEVDNIKTIIGKTTKKLVSKAKHIKLKKEEAKEKEVNKVETTTKYISPVDELLKLNELKEKGLLTEEEFNEQKKKLLKQ